MHSTVVLKIRSLTALWGKAGGQLPFRGPAAEHTALEIIRVERQLTGQSGVLVDPEVLERAARAFEHEQVLDTRGERGLEPVFAERVVDGDRHGALLVAVAHERVLVRLARDGDA